MNKTIATLATILALSGCAQHKLSPVIVYSAPDQKIDKTISIGDTAYSHYECPCKEIYKVRRDIPIAGRATVPANSIWEAKYNNTETGEQYLTSSEYHPQLALVTKEHQLNTQKTMVQFAGMKTHRTWSLENKEDTSNLAYEGRIAVYPSWKLQYLGTDKADKDVLRFSVATMSRSETIGQIEYTHNLAQGEVFVIKGTKFEVLENYPDGRLHLKIN
ncbi:hypothetical protein [Stutzerimonas nitrititolerans]|uniref:hypothetical protein n=1 Tax=Stutzerimonas nitrititolerans TaxID=2482751 RepID=UPI0028AE8FE7|nr:hypothetical protein [Stutzerimonas nitrititolerans]